MQKLKKFFVCTLVLSAASFLSHCGDSSVTDMNARQRDKDNEQQRYAEKVNDTVMGNYEASTQGSDLILSIDSSCGITNVTATQSNVPVASICGSLRVIPKLKLTAKSQPLDISYPYSNGNFNGQTKKFVLNIEQNGANSSTVTCLYSVVNSVQQMKCKWYTSTMGTNALVFKKTTDAALAALSIRSRYDQIYVGHNDQVNIMVQFNRGLGVFSGSQQPTPTILGEIVFFNRQSRGVTPGPNDTQVPYSISGGTFDPFSNTVTLTIGTSGAMQMNCIVQNAGKKLDCTFNSRVSQSFTLTQTTRR